MLIRETETMKKILFSIFFVLLCSSSVAQNNAAKFIGEGVAYSRADVAGLCLEWEAAKTTDQVVGTVAGTAVGGGLGAAAGKALGGKSGAVVGGLIGAGVGGAAGSSISGERKCLKREPSAYEYLVVMSDNSLLKVTQSNYISLRESGWSYSQKPTKVKVYQFPDQSYAILLAQ